MKCFLFKKMRNFFFSSYIISAFENVIWNNRSGLDLKSWKVFFVTVFLFFFFNSMDYCRWCVWIEIDQRRMVDGRWSTLKSMLISMVDGRWSMVDGRWSMVDGRWSMVDGRWSMVDGRRWCRWSMVVCLFVDVFVFQQILHGYCCWLSITHRILRF